VPTWEKAPAEPWFSESGGVVVGLPVNSMSDWPNAFCANLGSLAATCRS
jgi:hypothetical protein